MSELDLSRFDVLTFDCYGTIVDWDAGLLAALRPILQAHDAPPATDRDLLGAYARFDAELERGPYRSYREVLAEALRGICGHLGIEPSDDEVATFSSSVGDWPLFADSVVALRRLQERYRLAVITNCDDDLFAATQAKLGGVRFDVVVTAQQVGSYKPAHRNFAVAFERLGVPQGRILHVAQSLYHDHVPAGELGLASVWVDRRGDGTTEGTTAAPDLIVADLRALADRAAA